MPTAAITLPDGTSWVLIWDTTPTAVEPASLTSAPSPIDVASVTPSPDVSSPTSLPTQADVAQALNTAPPRWTATAWRFVKTLGAAVVATVAVYGGDVGAILRNPQAFLAALGTAVVAAVMKFAQWKG